MKERKKLKGEFDLAVDRAISESLTRAIQRKGESLTTVGNAIGVHPNIVSLWKTGRVTPSIANLFRLIDYFDDAFLLELDGKSYLIDRQEG